MDSNVLQIKSDIKNVRSNKNKNLISFHKYPYLSFNQTTLEQADIQVGMYAHFKSINKEKREILIEIRNESVKGEERKWHKIINPKVSNKNKYCYIYSNPLLFEFGILLIGAFEYEVYQENFNKYIKVFY